MNCFISSSVKKTFLPGFAFGTTPDKSGSCARSPSLNAWLRASLRNAPFEFCEFYEQSPHESRMIFEITFLSTEASISFSGMRFAAEVNAR